MINLVVYLHVIFLVADLPCRRHNHWWPAGMRGRVAGGGEADADVVHALSAEAAGEPKRHRLSWQHDASRRLVASTRTPQSQQLVVH